MRFDVFEMSLNGRDPPDHWDATEIAHGVSAQAASELSGLRIKTIETRVVKDGECFIRSGGEEFLVRLSRDED